MTKKELIEYLEDVPDDYIIVVKEMELTHCEDAVEYNTKVRAITVRYGEYDDHGVRGGNIIILES